MSATASLRADEFWVEGDLARRSTDSRQFGPVTRADAFKARVVLRLLATRSVAGAVAALREPATYPGTGRRRRRVTLPDHARRPEVGTDTLAPLPAPPRPDMASGFPRTGQAVSGRLHVPSPRGTRRMVAALGGHHGRLPAGRGLGRHRRRRRPRRRRRADRSHGSRSWRRSEASPSVGTRASRSTTWSTLGAAPVGSLAGRPGRRAPHLDGHGDRLLVRRADGRGPLSRPRRPTSPIVTAIAGRRCSSRGSIPGRATSISTRAAGRRPALPARSTLHPGPSDDLRERCGGHQRDGSQPAGVRLRGSQGPVVSCTSSAT